ncbi:DNA repair protein rhp26 [Coemansia biformis]|uniref:DNA repair protein rhp26 n=1 Tax=Coemansia biformis TaxID=1286918 RepID=A0A9W8CYC9_9FUNG|nr:DNA repair protein rhp26 [Coemansia biformis]
MANGSDKRAEDAELQGLSGLGVRVVGQSEMERAMHQQAERDLAEGELAVEAKRLARIEAALSRKQAQLARAQEAAAAAASAARRQKTLDRVDKLEEETEQLGGDRAEVLARIQSIELRAGHNAERSAESSTRGAAGTGAAQGASHDGAASRLASMVVPKRRAAAAAERRNRALEPSGDSSGSDSESRRPVLGSVSESRPRTALQSAPADESDVSYHDDASTGDGPAGDGSSSATGEPDPEPASDEAGIRVTSRGETQIDDIHDDGDETAYQRRVYDWSTARWHARQTSEPSSPHHADTGSESPHAPVDDDGRQAPRDQLVEEPFRPDPGTTDQAVKAHDRTKPPLLVPRQIWDRLLEYQRAGLRWMFALHQQGAGGILGDEMGLGKTVQVAAFLGSMYHSRLLGRPSLIVCPATLMRQWVRELHAWWPVLRVVILHNTGFAMRVAAGPTPTELACDITTRLPTDEADVWEAARAADPRFGGRSAGGSGAYDTAAYDSADDYEYDAYGSRIRRKRKPRGTVDWRKRQRQAKKKRAGPASAPSKASRACLQRAQRLVDHIQEHGHVVIVTYSGLHVYRDILLQRKWGYAVLDEGHMVRNPDADATLACKRLDTRHRLLVTGTPIQNNLTELWSLFDFIFPGRLGTLPVFTNQFAVPITVGGYATANPLQVRAAYRCACVLRDLIDPHLLRRLKRDVARDLPKKTEQVLFCRLTPMQRAAYASFLRSGDMEKIFGGKLQMLFGVDVVRKICDHPDLLLLSKLSSAAITHRETGSRTRNSGEASSSVSGSDDEGDDESVGAVSLDQLPADYGDWRKSGKMAIVRALLEMWQPQGHKVLIFSQTRQMLDIIERMVSSMELDYRRMDGTTPIQHRTGLVDEYNRTPSIFVFLLTTKVGGLGINLTGADRVILFSPDWNPSSDAQARERAWRLGQKRDVAVYRLMTAGTIEEKIYNRQIYKQFLSSKILEDPRQGRFFHSQSMRDLFSLADFDAADDAPPLGGSAPGGDRGRADDVGGPRPVTETGRMFAGAQLFPKSAPGEVSAGQGSAGSGSTPSSSADGITAIGGFVRLEPFEPADGDKEGGIDGAQQSGLAHAQEDGDEDRVLQNLFQISGMHSALTYDAIMCGGDGSTQTIDQEAARIAQDARRALRESQRSREGDVSIPTWTGVSGQAGAQPHGRVMPPPSAVLSGEPPASTLDMRAVGQPQRRPARLPAGQPAAGRSTHGSAGVVTAGPAGGASSATILAGLRAGAGDAAAARLNSRDDNDQAVAERIRDLLAQNGGELGNGALLKAFSGEFSQAEQPRLRRLALQVADLVSRPSLSASSTGIGRFSQRIWRLKDGAPLGSR